jgi:hypothetical protein
LTRYNRSLHLSIILILLIAFALRLWGLADHSIWWDEGRSASMARFNVAEIIQQLADGNHPPFHYIVLHAWWLLVGDGEFVLRFSSVLSGVTWVALTYRLGNVVGGRRAASMSALLLAISRFAVVWSQQIRMYSWAALWTTVVIIAALSYWRKRDWMNLILYVLSAVSCILSLYLTVSAVITVNLVFLYVWFVRDKSPQFLLRWICAQIAFLLLTMPWLLLNASHAETWAVSEPITLLEYARLYASILVVGNPIDLAKTLPFTLMAMIVFAGAVWVILVNRTRIWHRIRFGVLSIGLAVQAFVVYAVCFGIIPGFTRPLVPRYLLLLSSCFYVLVGWGLSVLGKVRYTGHKSTWQFVLVAMFIVPQFIGLSSLYPGRVRRDDYISIAEALNFMRYPDDGLILNADRDWPVFEAHYAGSRYNVPYGMKITPESVEKMLSSWWYEHDAMWVVFTPESLQVDPQQYIPSWLVAHALSSETIIRGENKLLLYIRNPERRDTVYAIPDSVYAGENNLRASPELADVVLPTDKYRTGDTIHLALIWESKPSAGYVIDVGNKSIHTRQSVRNMNVAQDTGYIYQIEDIILDPGLPGGKYQLSVLDNSNRVVTRKSLQLIQAGAGSDIALDKIPNPVSYRFGESIHLIGYNLVSNQVNSGGIIELTLFWRADAPISSRYKVFTHVLGEVFNANSGNFLWGQLDNEPVNGQILTTLWLPQSVIVDPYDIPVDPQAPPGSYVIEVGMYGLVDIERLPVIGSPERIIDNAVQLVKIEISSP